MTPDFDLILDQLGVYRTGSAVATGGQTRNCFDCYADGPAYVLVNGEEFLYLCEGCVLTRVEAEVRRTSSAT